MEVFVIMAKEKNTPSQHYDCYAVCESRETAEAIAKSDHDKGDITEYHITSYTIQTLEDL